MIQQYTPQASIRPQIGRGVGRSVGGQSCFSNVERAFILSKKCNRIGTCKPSFFRNCAASLEGEAHENLRHQLPDLPQILAEVIEYQQHRLNCERCGVGACGVRLRRLPAGVRGPRLVALVGTHMVQFRQRDRRVCLFCENCWNSRSARGWSSNYRRSSLDLRGRRKIL